MSSVSLPVIGGKVIRVTREDVCGVPLYGDSAHAVTAGFIQVAAKANYLDGTEITLTNANGDECLRRDARPQLKNFSIDVEFCGVDPDIYTAVTGFPKIIDPATGATIGFRINRSVRPEDIRWGLELWTNDDDSAVCDPSGDIAYGYLLWPHLSGARVGDYTINNGAVTFTAAGALTKDSSAWGIGPYDVASDAMGAAQALYAAVDRYDHAIHFRTTIAPPVPTDGLSPLDNPDGADATGATAGSPGAFTPSGSVRPADFAALSGGSYTASPTSAWTTGQYVTLGDGSKAHWAGTSTQWVTGKA